MRSYKRRLLIVLLCVLVGGIVGAAVFYAHRAIGRKSIDKTSFDKAPPISYKPQLVVQLGHAGSINSAVFSHDGRFVASGGSDRTAILWETATGREVRRFIGHAGAIRCVAFSPDGRWVLTGAGESGDFPDRVAVALDYTARLWNVATGKELQRFIGHAGSVNGAVFTRDGRSVITVSDDATVRLWNAEDGKEIKRFVGHTSAVTSICVSPDGRYVLTGDGESPSSHPHLWELEIRGSLPQSVDHSRRNNYTARLWEIETGKEVARFVKQGKGIGSVAFSPNRRTVLTTDSPPSIDGFGEGLTSQLWDISSRRELRSIPGYGPAVFSPDGQQILRGRHHNYTEDYREGASVWRINQGKDIHKFENGKNSAVARSVAFSPDGRLALVAFDILITGGHAVIPGSPALRLYDANSGKEILQFAGAASQVYNAEVSSDYRLIFAGDYLWNVQTGKEIRFEKTLKEHTDSADADLRVLSPDGRLALTTSTTGEHDPETTYFTPDLMQIWDTATGKEVQQIENNTAYSAYFSSDSRSVLTVTKNGDGVQMWDAATGKRKWSFGGKYESSRYSNAAGSWLDQTHTDCVLSSDGRFVLVRTDTEPEFKLSPRITVLQAKTGKSIREFKLSPAADEFPLLVLAPNNRYFAISESGNTQISLYDPDSGHALRKFKPEFPVYYAVFSPDSRYLALGGYIHEEGKDGGLVAVWEVNTGKKLLQFEGAPFHSVQGNMCFSSDGRYFLIAGYARNIAYIWDVAMGKEIRRLGGHLGDVYSVAFLQGGRLALTASRDGATRIWDVATGQELCRLISFRNGTWVVVTPDGRFDTNNLDDISGLYWTIEDDPMRLLPLEIFLRDYYEPRLLPRLLAGEDLLPVRNLSTLNRVQPGVKIIDIAPDSAETVQVTVEVSNAKSSVQKDTEGRPLESGVFDVRLFRNGQLVGYAPTDDAEAKSGSFWSLLTGATDNDGAVELNKDGKATLKFPNIKWPRTGVEQVEFSAYAFNVDRVKSVTDRKTFALTPKPAPIKGRAYLIRLGVNAYEREGLNLRYAANDARRMDDLAARLAARGEYSEVVSVPLISDYAVTLADGRYVAAQDATLKQVSEERKRVTENTATKAHLQTVLDVLAGRQANAALLKQIPNADKLRSARPEDLVLISASSHGYTDSNGIFYLVPSDTGTAPPSSPEFRSRCVSSDELSRWLRDMDAGELAMIVDACHSAAAIEGTGFKPGPMGSRGLGQLSYDKGMRILTATQADNVALEANKVRHGLLVYALLQDGLSSWLADYAPKDKSIMLTEWLSYGVERVPHLYEEMRGGRIRGTFDPLELEDNKTQQPSLFDFARRRREVVLARQP